jgi:tetrahydromethanopterin:alpha-L-glutamate ligase
MKRVGWLGASDGWYCRDLRRAALLGHWPEEIQIVPLAFDQLQVAYQGGPSSSVASSLTPKWESQAIDHDAILVRTMPIGSLEQTIFRMNALHVARSNGVRVINPPRSLEIAIDKWLTLETVRQSGLAIPRTICCQTREQAMAAWESLGRCCVVKPIFGGEGRGIMRISDSDMAWRVFSTLEQLRSVIYCQEFVQSPGYDLRLLVIADAVFCVKRSGGNGDWRTNVARGGRAEPYEPTFEQMQIAFKACRAVGTWMAGVDILTDPSDRNLVLEVNAVPGWKATANALDADIARVVLEKLFFEAQTLD